MTVTRNNDRDSRPRRRQRRITMRRIVLLAMLAAAIGLGWFLRDCSGLGLGLGLGLGTNTDDGKNSGGDASKVPLVTMPDDATPADATPDDAAADVSRPCELRLSSEGLTRDGVPIDVVAAVQACKNASSSRLRVTGGARSGTYDEVKQGFEAAGIKLDIHDSPVE